MAIALERNRMSLSLATLSSNGDAVSLRFSASAGDEGRGREAGIRERSSGGVGDHRAGDVRCSDRVINRVRVVAGRVGSDRQSCWNRCRDRCWHCCWYRRWQQTGRTGSDQTGEQNLRQKLTD